MKPVKQGQILYCEKCGVELQDIKDCDPKCACNIMCCGMPMKIKGQEKESGKACGCAA